MTLDDSFGRGKLNEMVDADELLASIGLDDDELAWRKRHIDFDEDDARRLDGLQPLLEANADEIADRFYDNLTPHDRTMAVIGRSEKSVEQLKQTQRAYLVTLATGAYGEDYFRNRARVGKLHELLDMPLHFYIGQYGVYYNLLFELLDERVQEEVVGSIREWTAEELAERDDSGVGTRLLGALRGDDGTTDEEAAALSASLEGTVREEIHERIAELLSVLRIINLDMQVAVDTYVDSYASKLERAIARRERLAREVQQDVRAPLLDVDDAADEIARGAQGISSLADESSEGVREMADEVSSISAATEEIATTAESVGSESRRARRRARESRRDAQRALDSMDDIESTARSAAADVQQLDDVFGDLSGTLDTLDDVARRTRQLGREATLESTKVGGDRETFRELADEVKSFADETEAEVEAIADRLQSLRSVVRSTVEGVEAAVDEVESGAEHVEASMADLDAVVDAIEDVTEGVEDVAEATDSQARSVEQVATAADQAAAATERVATETDDIAAATEEQKAQVEQVARNVGRLTDEAE